MLKERAGSCGKVSWSSFIDFTAGAIIYIGEDAIWNLLQSIFVFMQFSFLICIFSPLSCFHVFFFTSSLLLGGKKAFIYSFFKSYLRKLNNCALN